MKIKSLKNKKLFFTTFLIIPLVFCFIRVSQASPYSNDRSSQAIIFGVRNENPSSKIALAKFYLTHGQDDKAISILKSLLNSDESTAKKSYQLLALVYLGQKKNDLAIKTLNISIKKYNDPMTKIIKGWVLVGQSDSDTKYGIRLIKENLKYTKGDKLGLSYLFLGQAYFIDNNTQESMVYFTKAAQFPKTREKALSFIPALKKYMQKSALSGNLKSEVDLAKFYFNSHQYEKSISILNSMINSKMSNTDEKKIKPALYYVLALSYAKQEKISLAIKTLNISIQKYNDPRAKILEGIFLLGQSKIDTERGIQLINQNLQNVHGPDLGLAYLSLGKAYLIKHDPERAIINFKKSAAFPKTHIYALSLMNRALQQCQHMGTCQTSTDPLDKPYFAPTVRQNGLPGCPSCHLPVQKLSGF